MRKILLVILFLVYSLGAWVVPPPENAFDVKILDPLLIYSQEHSIYLIVRIKIGAMNYWKLYKSVDGGAWQDVSTGNSEYSGRVEFGFTEGERYYNFKVEIQDISGDIAYWYLYNQPVYKWSGSPYSLDNLTGGGITGIGIIE